PLLKKTIREVGEDNVTTLAASGAYNFFFSLFPLLLFLAPLLSVVGDKHRMVDFVMAQLVSVWTVAQFPLAFSGLVAFACMTFYLLPNARQQKGHVLIAAIVTTLSWMLATFLFRL